jgi:outer membrane protein assembly factor BamB
MDCDRHQATGCEENSRMSRRAQLTLAAAVLPACWCASNPYVQSARADTPPATAQRATPWPPTGPPVLWRCPLGEGESEAVAFDGALYTMFRRDNREHVVAISQETGKPLWDQSCDAPHFKEIYKKHGEGPHAAPLVTDQHVITLGISGLLHCRARRDGRLLWSHDLMKDYGGMPAVCGYAAAPARFEDTVIVLAGGPDSAIVALRLSDGAEVWRKHTRPIAYATPILIDLDGQTQMVALLGEEVVGLNPRDGDLLWRHPHKTEYAVNASRPLWCDDHTLYVTSAYGVGTRALRLTREDSRTTVRELWHQRKMQVHFGTLHRIGDHLYGTSGDFGPAFLTCVDAKTGDIAWQERDCVKKAQCLHLDSDRLLMLDEEGNLVLASVSPQRVTVHARHRVSSDRTWTLPTLVGTMLFVRDNKELIALNVGRTAAP